MSVSIHIDHRGTTPSGTIEKGTVNFGGNTVRFEDRRPIYPVSDNPFVLETGLASGLESLACAADTISALGHRAISVGHTHHDTKHPIRHNAEDIESVVESLTGDQQVHSTGLSRGFPAQVLATQHMPGKVISLTAVAPAMLAPVNPLRAVMLCAEVVREMARNPEFGKVLLDCAGTVWERPGVTISEAIKLVFGGNMHERVAELKRSDADVCLHLVSSKRDGFFDSRILEAIAGKLKFDTFRVHSSGTAGHGAFAYSPELVESVVHTATAFRRNQEQLDELQLVHAGVARS